MGYDLAAIVETGRELIDHSRSLAPGLIISDCELPDMGAIDAAREIYEFRVVPIVHICRFNHDDVPWQMEQFLLTHLVKPVGRVKLASGIEEAVQQLREFEILRSQSPSHQDLFEQRRTVNGAKKRIARREQCDGPRAFQHLQDQAVACNLLIVEAAQRILDEESNYPR